MVTRRRWLRRCMGPIIVVGGLGGTVVGGVLAQWWSKRTAKALFYVPALSAMLAVPPALVCFFGPHALTLPGLLCGGVLYFPGDGTDECIDTEFCARRDARDGDGGAVAGDPSAG